MNLTNKGHKIAVYADSFGNGIVQTIDDRHIHIVDSVQGSWHEAQLFDLVNKYNSRIDSQDWRDSWSRRTR